MDRITASAPILLVKDVVKSAEYFRDRVGFTPGRFWGEPPTFAIVRRDGFALLLSQVADQIAVTPHWKVVRKMWDAHFWVNGVESLYAVLRERKAIVDYSLCVQAHGVKEFGIRDPDGHDLALGQVVGMPA